MVRGTLKPSTPAARELSARCGEGSRENTNKEEQLRLDEVFAPLTLAEFVAEYWTRSFCRLAGADGRFEHLLPWSALNRILAEHRLASPRLRLVRNGEIVPEHHYRSMERSRDTRDPLGIRTAGLAEELSRGATLVIDAVDELYPPITSLASALENQFHEFVRINAYAGWRTSPGFDLHWDDHDVVILQIGGRKQWQVYRPTTAYPLTRSDGVVPDEADAVWKGMLEDGDALYIPRGWWHVAVPVDEPSLHLTCSIKNRTGLGLLEWLSDSLKQHVSYRQDLPRFADRLEQAAHLQRLKAILDETWDETLLARYFDDLNGTAPPRPVLELPDVIYSERPLSLETVVALNSPRPTALRLEDAAVGSTMRANGRTWSFTPEERPVISALLSGQPITLRHLCDMASPLVDFPAIEQLVRSLWSARLLTIQRDREI